MKLLKQRLKRLLVCLLAVSLLWQPIMAYAGRYPGAGGFGSYDAFVEDSEHFIGSVSDLQVGETYVAGATILADCYYDGTSIRDILGMNGYSGEIFEALFYVQEENGKSAAYYYGGFDRISSYGSDLYYTPLAYKLYDKYIDESGEERTVAGWRILDIEKIDDKYSLLDEHGSYLNSAIIDAYRPIIQIRDGKSSSSYKIQGFERRATNDYNLYVSYILIQVEPIYEGVATVTFDPNGGTLTVPESGTKEMAINDKYAPFPEATREQHDFMGWFTEDDIEITETDTKQTDGDEILYAHWEEWKYKIHFDPNGGTGAMDDLELNFSMPGIVPDTGFSNDGYTLLGWSRQSDATVADYVQGDEVTRVTEDKDGTDTLYAVWKPLPTVYFNANGGSECVPPSRKVAQGTEYGELPTTTREHYKFLGWFTEDDIEITATDTKKTDENETLYAHWEEYQYTIQFNANGGTGTMQPMTLKYSEEKSLTNNTFAREGYTFQGWCKTQNGASVDYADGATVQSLTDVDGDTVTLYAVWQDEDSETPPSVPGTPKVTFNPNGGSDCKPFSEKEVAQGDKYGELPTTTRAHYEFQGWFTAMEGGTKITETDIKETDKDETLYAHWEEYQYTIHFAMSLS